MQRPQTCFMGLVPGCGPLARYVKLRVAHASGMPWTWHASRHVRDLRAVMHAEIDNQRFPLKSMAGKRSRYSRCMRHPQFYVSGKRPWYNETHQCRVSNVPFVIAYPRPGFNIKVLSYQYSKSHYKVKTVVRESYLCDGNSFAVKTTSLF